MKKVAAILLLFVLTGIGGGFYFEALVKKGIEAAGTRVLGTEVLLARVTLSPFSGRGKLDGLKIKNPHGFKSDYAIEISRLEVELSVASIFSDTIEIMLINIEQPEITYEIRSGGTNIGVLLNTLSSGAEDSDTDNAVTAEDEGGKKIIIHNFVMSEPRVRLVSSVATVPVILPNINIEGIGIKEQGVTVAGAGKQIFSYLNTSLASVSLQDINVLKDGIEKKVEQIKNVLDKIF